jgi:hypothetical protein
MQITLEIPDEMADGMGGDSGAVTRLAMELLVVEGYRTGRLSAFQVRQMLGHESRWATEDFLAAHGAWPGTTVEELEAGLRHMKQFVQNPVSSAR